MRLDIFLKQKQEEFDRLVEEQRQKEKEAKENEIFEKFRNGGADLEVWFKVLKDNFENKECADAFYKTICLLNNYKNGKIGIDVAINHIKKMDEELL